MYSIVFVSHLDSVEYTLFEILKLNHNTWKLEDGNKLSVVDSITIGNLYRLLLKFGETIKQYRIYENGNLVDSYVAWEDQEVEF